MSYPGAREVGVEFFSLSKSFNLTGARISFLVGRSDVVQAFRKLHSQVDFGMFYPVQEAAIAALTGPLDSVKEQCRKYQERRDALCGGLRSIGWDAVNSHGSMFVWVPIPEKFKSSMDFCLRAHRKGRRHLYARHQLRPTWRRLCAFCTGIASEKIREAIDAIDESGILK